eukprot:Awhi_evm1s15696
MMTIKPQTYEALVAKVQNRVIYFNYLSNIEEDFNADHDTCDDRYDNIQLSTHLHPIKKKLNCLANLPILRHETDPTENKDFELNWNFDKDCCWNKTLPMPKNDFPSAKESFLNSRYEENVVMHRPIANHKNINQTMAKEADFNKSSCNHYKNDTIQKSNASICERNLKTKVPPLNQFPTLKKKLAKLKSRSTKLQEPQNIGNRMARGSISLDCVHPNVKLMRMNELRFKSMGASTHLSEVDLMHMGVKNEFLQSPQPQTCLTRVHEDELLNVSQVPSVSSSLSFTTADLEQDCTKRGQSKSCTLASRGHSMVESRYQKSLISKSNSLNSAASLVNAIFNNGTYYNNIYI